MLSGLLVFLWPFKMLLENSDGYGRGPIRQLSIYQVVVRYCDFLTAFQKMEGQSVLAEESVRIKRLALPCFST